MLKKRVQPISGVSHSTSSEAQMTDLITALEKWFEAQCDGDWEHEHVIRLETLDNPGWAVDIALEETRLQYREFKEVRHDGGDRDWIRCWVEGNTFRGRCSPNNLHMALQVFLEWAQ